MMMTVGAGGYLLASCWLLTYMLLLSQKMFNCQLLPFIPFYCAKENKKESANMIMNSFIFQCGLKELKVTRNPAEEILLQTGNLWIKYFCPIDVLSWWYFYQTCIKFSRFLIKTLPQQCLIRIMGTITATTGVVCINGIAKNNKKC